MGQGRSGQERRTWLFANIGAYGPTFKHVLDYEVKEGVVTVVETHRDKQHAPDDLHVAGKRGWKATFLPAFRGYTGRLSGGAGLFSRPNLAVQHPGAEELCRGTGHA